MTTREDLERMMGVLMSDTDVETELLRTENAVLRGVNNSLIACMSDAVDFMETRVQSPGELAIVSRIKTRLANVSAAIARLAARGQ